MAACSKKQKKDLLTDDDISIVLDIEDESDVFSRNLMIFGLIQVR